MCYPSRELQEEVLVEALMREFKENKWVHTVALDSCDNYTYGGWLSITAYHTERFCNVFELDTYFEFDSKYLYEQTFGKIEKKG